VAKVLLAFKTDLSEDERSSELQKLISSSVEPPPSDDEDESTSANYPPPFSVFAHKFGHFERVDPHWKEKRDKDRVARLLSKGLNHSEPKFRVSFEASKAAVETVQQVAASAKQATQGSVNWFDSYIMKAEGLFVGGGRRKLSHEPHRSVTQINPNEAEHLDVVAVSMDDLFGDDTSSGNPVASEDVVIENDSVPKKKLAWSVKRRTSMLSAPAGSLSRDSGSMSTPLSPIDEFDNSISTTSLVASNHDGSLYVTPADHPSLLLDHPEHPVPEQLAEEPKANVSFPHPANDPQEGSANVSLHPDAVSASSASPSSSGGLLSLFKESTKKLDSFLSSGSPARPVTAASAISVADDHSITHSDGSALANDASNHPLPHAHDHHPASPSQAPEHGAPNLGSDKRELQELVSVADVAAVGLTAAVSPSSSGGFLSLFKESTKKLDSFLSSGSPARPVTAASAISVADDHSIIQWDGNTYEDPTCLSSIQEGGSVWRVHYLCDHKYLCDLNWAIVKELKCSYSKLRNVEKWPESILRPWGRQFYTVYWWVTTLI
jgi:hypothetical protein